MRMFKSNLSKNEFLNGNSEYNKKYLSQLKSEYEKFKEETLPRLTISELKIFSQTGERLLYERKYFKRRAMLRDFALVYWLYGDKEALLKLEKTMFEICRELTWVLPAHLGDDIYNETIDLFACETAQTLAEIISLLGEDLSDETVKRCKHEIEKRVINPFLNRTKPYNWENMNGNWCAVCGGCIGMTALYLIENDALLSKVISDIKCVIDRYISSFADDGACLEGLYYWNYGMMYFTAFIDLYQHRMGHEFLTDKEKIQKIAGFASECCIGDGFTVSFSDGYERDKIYLGLMCKLNDLFGTRIAEYEYTAEFEGDECGRWCKAVRDIAWTKDKKNHIKQTNVFFPDAQWAIIRKNNMKAAVKGGTNAEPHNHNDIGSIIIIKDGEMVLCDLGAGEYTSDYFSDNRYSVFCTRSEGHSVPIINGCEQKAGESFRCNQFACSENRVSAEISGAYGIKELKSCIRTLICEDNKIVIHDEFAFEGGFEVTERFITRCEAVRCENTVKIMSHGVCKAEMSTDNNCNIEISFQPHREHDGRETRITIIDFKCQAKDEYNFLVKIS